MASTAIPSLYSVGADNEIWPHNAGGMGLHSLGLYIHIGVSGRVISAISDATVGLFGLLLHAAVSRCRYKLLSRDAPLSTVKSSGRPRFPRAAMRSETLVLWQDPFQAYRKWDGWRSLRSTDWCRVRGAQDDDRMSHVDAVRLRRTQYLYRDCLLFTVRLATLVLLVLVLASSPSTPSSDSDSLIQTWISEGPNNTFPGNLRFASGSGGYGKTQDQDLMSPFRQNCPGMQNWHVTTEIRHIDILLYYILRKCPPLYRCYSHVSFTQINWAAAFGQLGLLLDKFCCMTPMLHAVERKDSLYGVTGLGWLTKRHER